MEAAEGHGDSRVTPQSSSSGSGAHSAPSQADRELSAGAGIPVSGQTGTTAALEAKSHITGRTKEPHLTVLLPPLGPGQGHMRGALSTGAALPPCGSGGTGRSGSLTDWQVQHHTCSPISGLLLQPMGVSWSGFGALTELHFLGCRRKQILEFHRSDFEPQPWRV